MIERAIVLIKEPTQLKILCRKSHLCISNNKKKKRIRSFVLLHGAIKCKTKKKRKYANISRVHIQMQTKRTDFLANVCGDFSKC